uniref:Putative non-structural 4 protein n=1 Tax=Soybean thrips-associated tenui-like virus 1 TaxID=2796556 RepID=A0A7T3R0P9_9VIRU|nr:putative non-structural 4 protein [Soybean thrips-associated tenui-like virus 1]
MSAVTKKNKKENKYMLTPAEVAQDAHRLGLFLNADTMENQLVQMDEIEHRTTARASVDKFHKKMNLCVKGKHLGAILPLRKGMLRSNNDFTRIALWVIYFVGAHKKDTGTLRVTIYDSSRACHESAVIISFDKPAGGCWIVVGSHTNWVHRDNLESVRVSVEVSNSTSENGAIGTLSILLNLESTDFIVQFQDVPSQHFEFDPSEQLMKLDDISKIVTDRAKQAARELYGKPIIEAMRMGDHHFSVHDQQPKKKNEQLLTYEPDGTLHEPKDSARKVNPEFLAILRS